jgi:DNA-binding GntR family transcriptional regulator
MLADLTATAVKQPLAQVAYARIYRKIMTLGYAPGQRLDEKTLMDELGIGRTPIREALLRLAADCMVESQPNRGSIVRPITLQNVRAAFAALKILERGVAELAVRQDVRPWLPQMEAANRDVEVAVAHNEVLALVQANSRFHDHFARCANNAYLVNALAQVRCETDRLAYLSFGNEIDPLRTLREHYDSVVGQHRKIMMCLENQDEAGLKAVLEEHSQIFQERIIMYMAS